MLGTCIPLRERKRSSLSVSRRPSPYFSEKIALRHPEASCQSLNFSGERASSLFIERKTALVQEMKNQITIPGFAVRFLALLVMKLDAGGMPPPSSLFRYYRANRFLPTSSVFSSQAIQTRVLSSNNDRTFVRLLSIFISRLKSFGENTTSYGQCFIIFVTHRNKLCSHFLYITIIYVKCSKLKNACNGALIDSQNAE